MIAYRARFISRGTLKQIMHRLMLGRRMTRAHVDALAEAFADRVVPHGLHRDALPLVARERDDGRTLILATAAHRFYAEAIARRLGIERVVATESVWHEDKLTPVIRGENCHGSAKLRNVLTHLDATGLSGNRLHLRCYSDDLSDLPCFEASDECFVVNPSLRLARRAGAQGWRTLRMR